MSGPYVPWCGLTVKRIVHGGGIDVCDFLIEAALACPNLLDFRNQVVKIILVENLTVDQPVLVQDVSLSGKGIQHFCGPLAELCRPSGVDSIANSDDGREGLELILVGFTVIRNLCKFCTSGIFGQFAAFEYVFQVLGHDTALYIKELADGFLGQPNIVILYPDFDPILMGILRKHQKINGAIADLQLILLRFFHNTIQTPPRIPDPFFPRQRRRVLR